MTPTRALVVAPTPQLAASLTEWLTEAGCGVTLVTSFSAGKARLEDGPSVLVSEVRLGDYNGLHLALRAKARDIPAIVVGDADSVLQRDAKSLGVEYLTYQLDRSLALNAIERLAHPVIAGARSTHSASSALSFVSWDEIEPAVGDRDELLSHPARRTLGS